MSNASVLFDAPGPRARALSRTLSVITAVLVIGGLLWMFLVLNSPKESGDITLPGMFDESRWDIFANPEVWTFIGQGVWNTLRAALVASVLAVALGVVLSLLRSARNPWIRIPTAVVIEFFRGMPVLLMMLFILLVFSTGDYWAVVGALAIYNGALIGEALRAGLAALPRGQREAALSLGMRQLQSKMLVEFPQAFRQMLPIIVAQLVVLLKDTSLGFIVGYPELLRTTMNNLSSFYGNRYLFPLWVVTFLIYLAMNLSLSWFARWLSRRTASRYRPSGKGGPPVDPTQGMLVAEAMADANRSGSSTGDVAPGSRP
ncbi:amino acid ABC transporter membrane protein 2 (PAAT family) [Agromyces ramosus]|uniref:Amino acid ABC transporter membrane protein 2 (PAAT family) n=1 Tax=Agromyces ramosus TaxID=33879 RepID=A0A4Q7MJ40_9MICO|nr:amino acid ABC transporter permease [Agromyces ramosus]RZS67593.1 amino acid ABC transporter membrane protein 2 (PAAT family) [Agromyces ramosus]